MYRALGSHPPVQIVCCVVCYREKTSLQQRFSNFIHIDISNRHKIFY